MNEVVDKNQPAAVRRPAPPVPRATINLMTALPIVWPAGSMHDRKNDNTTLSYPEINAIGKST